MNTRSPFTRRTVTDACRAPQWQRLVTTIHKAQAAKGYRGQYFGAAEQRAFGLTLVGMPYALPLSRRVYWVERHTLVHSDDTVSVTYHLKAWDSSQPHTVDTIATEHLYAPSTETDDAMAVEFVTRAAFQIGGKP